MSTRVGLFLPWLRRSIAAVVLIFLGHVVYVDDDPRDRPSTFVLALHVATNASGFAQVFFDRGNGFRQEDSSSAAVAVSSELRPMRFALPLGPIRRLRIDYINGADAEATLRDVTVLDAATNTVLRRIAPGDLRPNDQIVGYQVAGDRLHVVARPGADDPQLVVRLDPPLQLGPSRPARFLERLPAYLVWMTGFVTLAWAIDAIGRRKPEGAGARESGWRERFAQRPRLAISIVAAVATAACCHPVIFEGRSFVSPEHGLALLHPDHGDRASAVGRENLDLRGSDTGAMLWQHLPYSWVQHRAIIGEQTLPLWNRYNSCGVALFGQGQSMLGDPLHLPVVLAGGAAWAWDAKFLTARFLFACGAGLAAFAATRGLGASALIALIAPFLGYFSYRVNHPALITMGYAPWLLAAWLETARAASSRAATPWLALLVAANACLLTSGTVKEASMIAVALNATGMLATILSPQARDTKVRIAAAAAMLGLGGALLAAPWWTAFGHTLQSAWTAYDAPYALRIPLERFAGLFDGMLYSEFFSDRRVYAPSANFVILLGVLLALVRRRLLVNRRMLCAEAAGLATVVSLAFSVPWLPETWILSVPGLRNVAHLGNTFSCAALPLLLVVAARGFATLKTAPQFRASEFASLNFVALVLLAPLLWRIAQTWQHEDSAFRDFPRVLREHGYFLLSLVLLPVAWGMLWQAWRWMTSGETRQRGAGIALFASALIPLLGRHGQVTGAAHDFYFQRLGNRAELAAPSPTLQWLHTHADTPFRLVGLSDHVVAGYAALHGIESPNGPDALADRRYRELAEAARLAPSVDWYFPTDPSDVAPRRRILDALNVRFYATCGAAPAAPNWMRPVHAADLTILESPSAWPRAFFVDRVAPCSTAKAWVHAVETGDGRPFAAIAPDTIQPDDLRAAPDAAERVIVPAMDYRLTTQTTEFSIEAPGPGLVVLMEAWRPGACRATLNGAPAEMVRVNHAFVGLRLDRAGVYRLRFEARHPAPVLALGLAGLGLVILALTFLTLRSHPARHP